MGATVRRDDAASPDGAAEDAIAASLNDTAAERLAFSATSRVVATRPRSLLDVRMSRKSARYDRYPVRAPDPDLAHARASFPGPAFCSRSTIRQAAAVHIHPRTCIQVSSARA